MVVTRSGRAGAVATVITVVGAQALDGRHGTAALVTRQGVAFAGQPVAVGDQLGVGAIDNGDQAGLALQLVDGCRCGGSGVDVDAHC